MDCIYEDCSYVPRIDIEDAENVHVQEERRVDHD